VSGQIRIGVGGWTYEPWRGRFYPEKLAQKDELEYASRRLTSIEINGTFYGSQKPETFARWHDETPDGFVFALKAPRYATHRRVLSDPGPGPRVAPLRGFNESPGRKSSVWIATCIFMSSAATRKPIPPRHKR